MSAKQAWKDEKDFAKRVRLLRESKRFPQRALLPLGVKQSYIANLETGNIENPSPEMMAKLAKGYGVKVEDLVAGTQFEASFKAAELPTRAYCPNNLCPKLQLNHYRTGMIIPYRFSIERVQVSGKQTFEAKFCPYCGGKLLTACPSCKKPILIEDPEQTHCLHCGHRLFEKLTEEQVMAKERRVED